MPALFHERYTDTMKITKYEHACFTIEHQGKIIVIDPGVYTTNLPSLENVVAIIVTHEHADHFDPAALGALIAHNPKASVVAHHNITRQFGDANETLPYKSVEAGDAIRIEPFNLEFFGGAHAIIHPDIPAIPNLGVMINDTVYYPGDSFADPKRPVAVLALPISAPWLKISESIDYLVSIEPTIVFPTHDAILSPVGRVLIDRMIPTFAAQAGSTYQRIDHTPLEI